MKKILGIIVLGLMLIGNVYAGKIKTLSEEITVNSLLKDGWILYSTNAIGVSGDTELYNHGKVFYHLIKNDEIITCIAESIYIGASSSAVNCYKP